MPVVTKIEKQKRFGKGFDRINIYLDGKFSFGLDLETLVKLNIKAGIELSDEEIQKIVKKAEFQKNLDYLLKFATLRPRSEKEITSWFYKHKTPTAIQNELLEKLKKLELLDDYRFAKWWIEQRLQFKFKSKRELEQELRIKGIKKDIIQNVFKDQPVDEEKEMRELLKKNTHRWVKYDKRTARQKMMQFLARKGFEWNAIKKVTGFEFQIDE